MKLWRFECFEPFILLYIVIAIVILGRELGQVVWEIAAEEVRKRK